MKPTFFKALKLSNFFKLLSTFRSFGMLPATQCHEVKPHAGPHNTRDQAM
jgi:hypothetical protein